MKCDYCGKVNHDTFCETCFIALSKGQKRKPSLMKRIKVWWESRKINAMKLDEAIKYVKRKTATTAHAITVEDFARKMKDELGDGEYDCNDLYCWSRKDIVRNSRIMDGDIHLLVHAGRVDGNIVEIVHYDRDQLGNVRIDSSRNPLSITKRIDLTPQPTPEDLDLQQRLIEALEEADRLERLANTQEALKQGPIGPLPF